jgi:hypothetical protein
VTATFSEKAAIEIQARQPILMRKLLLSKNADTVWNLALFKRALK